MTRARTGVDAGTAGFDLRRRPALAYTLILVLLLAGSSLTSASAVTPRDGWTARPATFGVHVAEDVPIRMSDGVVLRANVLRPAAPDGTPAAGRFPTLLTQTPYRKGSGAASGLPYLVERGYVDVVVDIRGTGTSGGTFASTFSPDEQRDGKELVAWAAEQPWSTGDVGLHGASYLGINQLLTAAQQPPALRATFPVVPNGDAYRTNFPGGYLTSLAAFALLYPANGVGVPGYAGQDPAAALATLGTRPAGLAAAGTGVAGLAAGDERSYDGPYIQAQSPLSVIDRITAPTFVVGGWQDALSQRDGGLLFRALQQRGVPTKLVMGPWTHTTPGAGLPADGVASLNDLQLRWFDHYVAGLKDNRLKSWGPAFLHRSGAGYERVDSWTPKGVVPRQVYLGEGSLSAEPPQQSTPDRLPWQPAAGICTGSSYVGTFGLPPQTPCTRDNRANALTAVTYDMPLEQDLDLTGPFAARLFVSTTGRDAHVVVRVESVAPSGEVIEHTTGWDTLSFRALDDERSDIVDGLYVRPHHPYTEQSVLPVTPGEIYEWWIEVRPTSVRIPQGHTLRVSLQTADTVRFVPTARHLPGLAGSVMSIHHDAAHPSSLVLPVVQP